MTIRKTFATGYPIELPDLDLPDGVRPLRLLWVRPGTFLMGSPPSERGRYDDEGQFEVTISRGFWLGQYLVTQAQFTAGLRHGNRWPSLFSTLSDSADRPVEQVSWGEAIAFCKELNSVYADNLPAGYGFSLPTEAQWEYVCRAGTRTRYHSGDADEDLDHVDWHAGNSGGTTHPVGQKPPNPWGFFDMHGNVQEWCYDCYSDYPDGSVVDWEGPKDGMLRNGRGRSWSSSVKYGEFRSASRCDCDPRSKYPFTGFRLSLRWIQ